MLNAYMYDTLVSPYQVFLHELDLSSQESVRECAHKLVASLSKIDVLVNNAGVSGYVCYAPQINLFLFCTTV